MFSSLKAGCYRLIVPTRSPLTRSFQSPLSLLQVPITEAFILHLMPCSRSAAAIHRNLPPRSICCRLSSRSSCRRLSSRSTTSEQEDRTQTTKPFSFPSNSYRGTKRKKMYLKKPLWSEGVEKQMESETETAAATAVGELANSLKKQRVQREITLALRTGLRDARAEFSFLRVRGLRSLLKILRSVAESDSTIHFFCQSQSVPELQVVPVLFQHSFKEDSVDERVTSLNHIFTVDPMRVTSPSTDAEVALALRVLEGCCLLHRESAILAHKHKAIKILMNILSTRGALEQGACLDALTSLMLDSSANQLDFEACNGIEEVAELIRDKQVDENLRLRCGEFLLLLIGHVNGRQLSPMATIHEDIRRLLGEKSASLIWAASQFGSTLNPEERLTALHIQARRVLESLDLY